MQVIHAKLLSEYLQGHQGTDIHHVQSTALDYLDNQKYHYPYLEQQSVFSVTNQTFLEYTMQAHVLAGVYKGCL